MEAGASYERRRPQCQHAGFNSIRFDVENLGSGNHRLDHLGSYKGSSSWHTGNASDDKDLV